MARAESVPAETSAGAMDAFFTGMAAKDRTNVEKHLAAVDAEAGPGHGRVWRQLATAMRKLAPHAVQTVGQQIVQFFIADGKYRKQVFALEDARDGRVMVYMPDVLAEAEKSGAPLGVLKPEVLDAANTPNPSPHVKHMLGWNRKAVRITLLTHASSQQVSALEKLTALASERWAKSAKA